MRFTIEYLKKERVLRSEVAEKLLQFEKDKPLSIFWHVRIILYLGVTLLTGGLGTLIYVNIDTIGHLAIVCLIGIASISSIIFCFLKASTFSLKKIESDTWLDYLLLFGALTFLIFEGYLQWQYDIFGNRYGLATIIPSIILFFLAYRFDHLGVLSMGITLFASWVGLSLTPNTILSANDFSDVAIIQAAFTLAISFWGIGYLHQLKKVKLHFSFTYYNFALHLGALAALGATFSFDYGWLWVFTLIPSIYLGYIYAIFSKSFYFLLFSALYAYFGAAYLVVRAFLELDTDFILAGYALFIYFIASAIYFIIYIKKLHKKISD